jgi:hypothetical protein
MTDDILTRLRGPYEWRSIAKQYSTEIYDETPLDAADEIERLRAALQAIAQCPIPVRIPGRVELWSLAVQMQETAIAALREASDDAAP